MIKITRLKKWTLCGCLFSLAYILPLQARAESSVRTLEQNHKNNASTSCTDFVPSIEMAQTAESISSACPVALSGPLIASESSTGSAPPSTGSVLATSTAPEVTPVEEMVYQVNQLRASKGLSPLKANATLSAAAQDFATRMGGSNFFSHNDPDNGCSKPWDRMQAAGYVNWNFAAENIAAGYNSATTAMTGFINSPSHYNTLVNPNLREIGVGLFNDQSDANNVRLISTCPSFTGTSGPFTYYWVQDYGSHYVNSAPMLPIVIDQEAPNTASRDVTVYVYGNEYGQPQWVSQMRFSTDGTTWTAFEPYAAQKTITLPRGTGMKTVYAQLKNATGTTQSVSDSIFLVDSSVPVNPVTMPYHVYMPTLQD